MPGRYEFFGEFNPNSAQGAIIVKPNKLSSNIKTRAASDVNILALNTAQKRVTHRVLVKELYRAD